MPDVTAVTAILIRPATAVEATGIGRSVGRSDLGLRFLAAMVLLGRPGCVQPGPDASLSGYSRSGRSIAFGLDETLKRSSQSDVTNGDGLQIYAIAFPPSGVLIAALWFTPQRRYLATLYR